MANRNWSELSAGRQALLLALVSVEMSLTATAAVDLIRRPADQVHGRKVFWALGLLVQPVGPVAYLCAHRR